MKISIITTVLNRVDTIETCIKSVLSQSYENIEYIIVDGGSTDGTVEIIRKYQDKIAKFISEPDKGIYDALNKGIRLTTGEIIGILNSDDFYAYKDVLLEVSNFIKEKNVDSCYGDLCYVFKNSPEKILRYWKADNFNIESFKRGWMPPHPTFFIKKEVYDKYGLFDLNYKISADYEFMLRVLYKEKISTGYINKIFVKMRVGGASNKSIRKILSKMKEDYSIVKKYNLGGIKTLIFKNFRKIPQFIS